VIGSRLSRGSSWWSCRPARLLSRLLGCAALFLAYVALAEASYVFVFPPEKNALFWLPSGLTVALLLRTAPARWPAWLLVVCLAEALVVVRRSPLPLAAAWGCANALLPLTAALLLRGPSGRPFALQRVGDVVRLTSGILAAAIPGALVAATATAAWVRDAGAYARVAVSWWSSDVFGVLLLCPLLLAWTRPAEPRSAGPVETAMMLVALTGLAWWVFGSARPRALDAALPLLLLPPSTWAALRLGLRGATSATAILDLVATGYTVNGRGAFAMVSASVTAAILNVQMYASFLSLFFLVLAVVVTEEQRALWSAEQAKRRSEFLARASAILSESLDFATRIAALSRLCVESLAEWCVIDVVEAGELRCLSGVHRDPSKERLLRRIEERHAGRALTPRSSARIVRTGQPVLIPELTDEMIRDHALDDESARAIRELGARTMMAVPLCVRGQTIGAMTLVSAIPGRRYGPADLALASELSDRAAIALDNARLYRDAQEAIRLRDEFLSIASHELNTPVTTIQLTVQALRRSAATSPGAIAPPLARVERQVRKLARQISELLDVSRITVGRMDVEVEDVDLTAVVRDVADRLADDLSQADCRLVLHTDGAVVGRWDGVRLEQVVTNLLANAIKFGAGRPIEVSIGEAAGTARLVVRDEGIGLPADRLPYVFDRFERAVPARAYGGLGLGLGLYIARSIVEALGGSIRVESAIGAGATFTVELPRAGPAGRTA